MTELMLLEVASKFPLRSLVKIDKRQSVQHIDGTTSGGLSS